MNLVAPLLCLALYAMAFMVLWQNARRVALASPQMTVDSVSTTTPSAALHPTSELNLAVPALLSLAALCAHAWLTWHMLTTPAALNLGLVPAINLITLLMNAVVLGATLRMPVANLNLLLYPMAMAALLAALLDSSASTPLAVTAPMALHILLSLTAYCVLMMAACQAVLLAMQENNLKTRNLRWLRILPPLESMERLFVSMLWLGMLLLSGAIASGFIFLENMFDQRVVHHTVLTCVSWLVYAAFLYGRYRYGWRGMTSVRWTSLAFALLVLGYLGSKFVVEYLLS